MFQYKRCVKDCNNHCDKVEISSYMKLLLWDCDSECKYNCMQDISQKLHEQYNVVLKFYGHWPYLRLFGLQEPASVIFSLGNALPHIHNIAYNRKDYLKTGAPFGKYILIYSVVSLLAWFASAFFHARKIEPFIAFDYIFAFLLISYGLWLAIYRFWWELYRNRYYFFFLLFSSIYYAGVLYQILEMLNDRVLFGDHMQLSIGLSIGHAVVWLLFVLISSSPNKSYCVFCQVWFGAASLLELFDFPPYFGYFDAHALWHAATIPLGFFWFRFWLMDCEYVNSLLADARKKEN